jgi:hypothetical protein
MKKSLSSTNSEIAEALAKKIPADRIADVLLEAMSATTTNRAGVTEPDTRCRLQAATLSLAYLEGRPSERTEVIAKTQKMTPDEMVAKLKCSPAFRAEIADLLAKANQ